MACTLYLCFPARQPHGLLLHMRHQPPSPTGFVHLHLWWSVQGSALSEPTLCPGTAMVGAEPDEIHFTSCGTEADAW